MLRLKIPNTKQIKHDDCNQDLFSAKNATGKERFLKMTLNKRRTANQAQT